MSNTKNIFTKSVRIGDTQPVLVGQAGSSDEQVGETLLSDKIKKALRKGLEVTLEDGDTIWIEAIPIVDLSKDGSDSYIWDKTENRVKHERVQFTLSPDGTKTSEIIGASYKSLW